MAKKELKAKEKGKGLWAEFKEFINKGNAFMLAVGVVIGGAFSAIVNAFVNILMSVATWAVPGGLKGLVTVLPALTDGQKGAAFLPDGATEAVFLQEFAVGDVNQKVIDYAAANGVNIDVTDVSFIGWKTELLSRYEQHGGLYTYKMSAIIDWGTLINAVISFIIIAVVLFIIVKVSNSITKKAEEAKAEALKKIEKPAEEAEAK